MAAEYKSFEEETQAALTRFFREVASNREKRDASNYTTKKVGPEGPSVSFGPAPAPSRIMDSLRGLEDAVESCTAAVEALEKRLEVVIPPGARLATGTVDGMSVGSPPSPLRSRVETNTEAIHALASRLMDLLSTTDL